MVSPQPSSAESSSTGAGGQAAAPSGHPDPVVTRAARSSVRVDLAVAGSPSMTVSLPAGTRRGQSHSTGSRATMDAGRTAHCPKWSARLARIRSDKVKQLLGFVVQAPGASRGLCHFLGISPSRPTMVRRWTTGRLRRVALLFGRQIGPVRPGSPAKRDEP
jgi:hypothetical protein